MRKGHSILLFGAIAWFVAVYCLGAAGVFVSGPEKPPVGVALAFLVPILLFLAAMSIPGWRNLVISIPPVFLITLNGWRFVGLGFLMGYAEGLLPGRFAFPAGLGDLFMAVTAPWIAACVVADDRFRSGGLFLAWNLLGIADFVDAVSLGTLYMWPGFSSSVGTQLMQRLPFSLIPTFGVPLIAMAHITLLAQRGAKSQA